MSDPLLWRSEPPDRGLQVVNRRRLKLSLRQSRISLTLSKVARDVSDTVQLPSVIEDSPHRVDGKGNSSSRTGVGPTPLYRPVTR